jgi:hypothetical protein
MATGAFSHPAAHMHQPGPVIDRRRGLRGRLTQPLLFHRHSIPCFNPNLQQANVQKRKAAGGKCRMYTGIEWIHL